MSEWEDNRRAAFTPDGVKVIGGGGGGGTAMDANISEVGGQSVDPSAGIPVHDVGTPVAPTDLSGTIITASTAQQLSAANPSRKSLMVQNVHDTDDLWISKTGTASAGPGSIRLKPNTVYEAQPQAVPNTAISIYSDTAAHPFTAEES